MSTFAFAVGFLANSGKKIKLIMNKRKIINIVFFLCLSVFALTNLIFTPYSRGYQAIGIDSEPDCDVIVVMFIANILLFILIVCLYVKYYFAGTNLIKLFFIFLISCCVLYWGYYYYKCEHIAM